MDGISMPIRSSVRRAFLEVGNICFNYPWEIILSTTLCTIAILSSDSFWLHDASPAREQELQSMSNELDMVVLIATKCLIVAYCYLQMRRFALLGARYEFGLAALLTVAQAYVFTSAALAHVYERSFALNDVLPVFLLLTDFSKVFGLARCVLVSLSVSNPPKHAIQFGLVACGPSSFIDSALQVLVIGLGIFGGNESLERVCVFGCVAIALNLIMFTCYYPAVLSLVFQLGSPYERERVLREVRALLLPESTESDCQFEKRTNPVLQRIKVIMSAGLIVVHAQLRVLIHGNSFIERSISESMSGDAISGQSISGANINANGGDPNVSAIDVPFYGTMAYRTDSLFTFFLAFLLILKYTFLDNVLDDLTFLTVRSSTRKRLTSASESRSTSTNANVNSSPAQNGTSLEDTSESSSKSVATTRGAESADTTEATAQRNERVRLVSGGELDSVSDELILERLRSRQLAAYTLESVLKPNFRRAVDLRRRFIAESSFDPQRVGESLERLPFTTFDDYATVHGVCCENVVGYVPIPVGIAGPLLINGRYVHLPLATTEGGLVASTNRGCRAILDSCAAPRNRDSKSSRSNNDTRSSFISDGDAASSEYVGVGIRAFVTDDGMSRGPVVRFANGRRAAAAREWLLAERNFELMKVEFDATSRFASLKRVEVRQVGRVLYLRFVALTGDAMGMNMVSRATERVLTVLRRDHFTDMIVVALSGNVCVDKKASAMNWIEGRGKSVTCETVVRAEVVHRVLKTTVGRLVETHTAKNLVGSAIAGAAFGGQNAHAANIIAALFIACGQDAAQVVTSSSCLMNFEREPRGRRTRRSTLSESDRIRNDSAHAASSATTADVSNHSASASGKGDESDEDDDLYVSCTMPCLEVAVVGGGTILSSQRACLSLMGMREDDRDSSVSSTTTDAHPNINGEAHERRGADGSVPMVLGSAADANAHRGATRCLPGERASEFAMAVCAAVLAGELSLLAALSVGHLTEAHERLNRRKRN